ncbi:MAG TPA: hypothetical protein DGZ24_05380 [Rhodospirillaceae bacterium]|nr:hypothetical protein [Candidatus Neomarinimicrobiota bacterium]HCX14730.1 hypothetical protein [Rhodospirillaceae bacterium]
MTTFYPLILLISTIAFLWLGRHMAKQRNRNSFIWGLAGAFFPPSLLILKFLNTLPGKTKTGDLESGRP